MRSISIVFGLLLTSFIIMQCTDNEPSSGAKQDTFIIDTMAVMTQGNELATLAQSTLLANVSKAMKEGGPVHTIQFCNSAALSILDSVAGDSNISLGRISDRYRNPLDAPTTANDKMAIEALKNSTPSNAKPMVLADKDGSVTFYKPIFMVMPTCLKCHGDPASDLSSDTRAILASLYPEDRATGYKMGEFRGAWKINFPKPE